MLLTLPTLITLARIGSLPFVILAFYWPDEGGRLAAALLFAAGGVTDWLDGWIARRYGLGSAFGAFLDPVADKLAIAVALFLVIEAQGGVLLTGLACVMVGREIAISALREWMASVGCSAAVRVAFVGKVKTVAQLVALPCLMYSQDIGAIPVKEVGLVLLSTAGVLSLWSATAYVHAAIVAGGFGAGRGSVNSLPGTPGAKAQPA